MQPTTIRNADSTMLTAVFVVIAILVTVLIFVCALYFRRTYQEVRISWDKNHTGISLDRKCITVNDVRIRRSIVVIYPSNYDLLKRGLRFIPW